MQHRCTIILLARLLVSPEQVTTSVLVLECNYTSTREKHQRIQADSATCTSIPDLSQTLGDNNTLTNTLKDLDDNTARYLASDTTPLTYRYILTRVTNNDLSNNDNGNKSGVMKWVHWGFPTEDKLIPGIALNVLTDCSMASLLTLINAGTMGLGRLSGTA
jgi:hypothetical protein